MNGSRSFKTGCLLHHVCAPLCTTLCDPMDCSPAGSSVHGIFQARIMGGLPFPIPGDLPDPGIELMSLASPALADRSFTNSTTLEWNKCWHLPRRKGNDIVQNASICWQVLKHLTEAIIVMTANVYCSLLAQALSEVRVGERESQDSNPGSPNPESGF